MVHLNMPRFSHFPVALARARVWDAVYLCIPLDVHGCVFVFILLAVLYYFGCKDLPPVVQQACRTGFGSHLAMAADGTSRVTKLSSSPLSIPVGWWWLVYESECRLPSEFGTRVSSFRWLVGLAVRLECW